MRVTLPCLYFLILFFNCHLYSQIDRQAWKDQFKRGSFDFLEKELDSIIQTNHPEKKEALKILGDLYKVRGDVETAYFYWKQSDAILNRIHPGLNSKAIKLAHLSNFYFEKFNPEMTKLYNDSLIVVVSKLKNIAKADSWIWNVIAQSNKLPLDKKNGEILFHKYEQYVFPYYEKNIQNYKTNKAFSFQLARTYHLYANAYVDLVHAFNSDLSNRDILIRLENKANRLYNKALAIYTNTFGTDHYEIARVRYVKALLYQYAHPESNSIVHKKTIDLFEAALAVFDLKNTNNIVNIGEALGCAKQYHRSLYQTYRLNINKVLKYKQDSIFKLSKKLWIEGVHVFKSKNPNQLISLYGLSPFTERIYQIYYEYSVMGIGNLNDVFYCMQQLKYQDKKQWNESQNTVVKSIEDVQQELNETQCYLEFSSVPKPVVLIVSRDQFNLVELDVDKSDVDLFYKAIQARDFNDYVTSSIKLSRILFRYVELSKYDELFISPSGWFSQIAFQALLVSSSNTSTKDYRKLDYLLNHVDIQYLFSACDLKVSSSIRPWQIDLFVPQYNDNLSLPFAELFAKEFKYSANLYKGQDAISSTFKNTISSILHYSGHGNGSDVQREAAELTFSDCSIGIKDIYETKVHPNLVILNACSSGKGVFNSGDGVNGFPRAFYMMGAQQILSTFWDLDDRASHKIMESFYQNLALGIGSNHSLRQGQRNYISSAKNSSMAAPYYWAGHQLYGPNQSFQKQMGAIGLERFYYTIGAICCGLLIIYILFKIRPAKS